MPTIDVLSQILGRLPQPLVQQLERLLQRVPWTRRLLDNQFDRLLAPLDAAIHPYRRQFTSYDRLPPRGRARPDVLAEMRDLQAQEATRWKDGYVSGAVYSGDPEHVAFLNEVYALNSQSNPLHFDLWPSSVKYEAEIVAMTAQMLGADGATDPIVGTVTSGGTESILLAMRTYRDWARVRRGITKPELIAPETAHAAFDKAAQYFSIKLVRVPVGKDLRADVEAMKAAINRHTIAMVGSAPSFPHGVVDPIAALSAVALEHGIGFHTDACLGGFLLPWAEKLGYPVPVFDFRLPGVTSMSVDTHKYGYAAKGTSVVLYRGLELRRMQYFAVADWPGGLYFSPTFAGSRPGALSAACWAAMVSLGEEGYLDASRGILVVADMLRKWVGTIPELELLGDSLFVVAFSSSTLDIYRILDAMNARGWSLNGLHHPPALHLCVTQRHVQPGVAQRFVSDLYAAVDHVKTQSSDKEGMAPIYGMAASMPMHGMVEELLRRTVDPLYRV